MRAQNRELAGNGLAVVGSGLLLLSLWQSWYSFRIPGFLLDQAVQNAGRFGILGPQITQGAEFLRTAGPLHVTAWQVMTGSPALLLGASVLAGALAVLGLAERARGGAKLLLACGGVALVVTVYQLVHPPGTGGLLRPASGAWLALGAAVALLAGGRLSDGSEPPLAADTLWGTAPFETDRGVT